MSDENGFERLDLWPGLNVVQMGDDFAGTILSADFGGGYKATAVVNEDVREWLLQADALVDLEDENLLVGAGAQGMQTRARYLWGFYRRHMLAGQRPFWFRCPFESADFLAEFTDTALTYDVFTSVLYAAGFTLRQRRVRGVESQGAQVAEENPDSI